MWVPAVISGMCVRESAWAEDTDEKTDPPVRGGDGKEPKGAKREAENGSEALAGIVTKD